MNYAALKSVTMDVYQILHSTRGRADLARVAHDVPSMRAEAALYRKDKLRFMAHHNSLVNLADHNNSLLKHLGALTGNQDLQKVSNYPGWIHQANVHDTTFRISADLGVHKLFG